LTEHSDSQPLGLRPGVPTEPVHGGIQAVAAARAHGVNTMFTLSGAHVFPLYDAAVGGVASVTADIDGPMRLIDVRHEQTAAFAAEATGKLTRTPGLAVVTAGPGVTNTVSAITGAWINGSPMVVIGGRAPDARWGYGALQELDHPPLVASVTKSAQTIHDPAGVYAGVDAAFALAASAHRGPTFVDVPMDALFTPAIPTDVEPSIPHPNEAVGDLDLINRLIAAAARPVLVLGGDVWADGAEVAAVELVEQLQLPVIANGMARGILAPQHPCLVTRARGAAFKDADLVVVAGTAVDFRLGFGVFGDPAQPTPVIHLTDSAPTVHSRVELVAQAAGPLAVIFNAIAKTIARPVGDPQWLPTLRATATAIIAADDDILHSDADPIHPARIYGDLLPRLAQDAVVIGDGGDFVSFAGRFHQPALPGRWLDPGPYGCLGTGLGYAMAARIAHPSSQVVALLGDGAVGFSLMDVDSAVRQNLPMVMVVANNAGWGLERHPMRFLYGYDVVADLAATRYDEIVTSLGGGGETVTHPTEIGPALDRAFAANVPYLVNVMTDPEAAYPRSTTGI